MSGPKFTINVAGLLQELKNSDLVIAELLAARALRDVVRIVDGEPVIIDQNKLEAYDLSRTATEKMERKP